MIIIIIADIVRQWLGQQPASFFGDQAC